MALGLQLGYRHLRDKVFWSYFQGCFYLFLAMGFSKVGSKFGAMCKYTTAFKHIYIKIRN